MNEREIFQEALEHSDPGQRQAYLNQACGGDAALRERIQALLLAHDSASQFLNVPALEQLNPRNEGRPFQTVDFPQTGGTNAVARDDDIPENETLAAPDLSFLNPSSKPGSLGMLGHYEILNLLGQGAFGLVFRAFDEKLHRQVAIKVMNPQLATTSPPRKRFLREARSAAAIKHENIVQVYSVEEQPLPYLVMEYVEGQTLKDKLDNSGPLEISEILHLGRQMANGLAAAHAQGLIHRDIKPGNILIEAGAEQKVKITDFGLARAADDATITRTGVISGTPMYMAPEQAQGMALDHRADLFSLGSVLYQIACGRPPFRGANAIAVLKRVTDETPRPIREILPEVPDWLCAIIAKLHAKKPEDRFQSAREVADLLSRCQASLQQHGWVELPSDYAACLPKPVDGTKQEPVFADHSPGKQAALPPRSSRRRWAATAAAVLVALFGGLSLTEATGITNVRGTVVRLFSPDGTLVVEVDDPGVSVSIDGEEMVITGTGVKEIRLKPGQYKVLASKDGKVVSQELVTVTKNGRQVVRVSRESPAFADARPPMKVERRPRVQSGGEWHIEGNELVQALPQGSFLMFGDPGWTDYIVEVEGLTSNTTKEVHGFRTIFRAQNPDNHRMFDIGNYAGNITDACYFKQGKWGRTSGCLLRTPFEKDRWYKIKVEVNGSAVRCSVDGKLTFAYSDDDLPTGMIGLASGGSPTRWRNLKVTAPDGRVLWEGFPEFDAVASKTALPPPDLAAAPFDEQKAKQHQAEWAKYLNRKVVEENSLGMKLTLIPPVQFQMGANEVEKDGAIDFKIDPAEKPQHSVTFTRPFLLSATEVTQEQFAKIMGRNLSGHNAKGQRAEQVKEVDSKLLPVEMVSWFDAVEFCNKLSEKEGLPPYYELTFPVRVKDGWISVADVKVLGGIGYRLPTEAEWECACRAGTTTPFSFPFDYGTLGQYGWFGYIDRTHAVAERKPNPFGLHDMHGNVHEWCFDWFGPYSRDSLRDPSGPSTGTERVCRGGAYNYLPPYARSAWRGKSRPGARLDNTGLRVARFVTEDNVAPSAMTDPDRKAAEWVLANGGKLQIAPGGYVVSLDKLPTHKFTIGLISFDGLKFKEESELKCLAQLAHLEQVFLGQAPITGLGLGYFATCPEIAVLALDSTAVRDSDLGVLKNLKKLQNLTLHNTRTTDAAIEHILECPRLTQLDLSLTGITDAGLKKLEVLKGLQFIQVYQTKVSAEGVKKFAAALPGCKIRWDGGVISPKLATDPDRRAAEFILSFPHDYQIAVQVNDVDRWIGKASDLPAGPFHLTGVGVEWALKLDDDGLANFAGCKNVKILRLVGTQVTAKGLVHFKDCQDLRELSLVGDLITDSALEIFKGRKLNGLHVKSKKVTDAGLAHFQGSNLLTSLAFKSTPVTDQGMSYFRDNKNLKHLELADTQVTDAGLANFQGCKDLESLSLFWTRVSDDGLVHFKECKKLKKIDLGRLSLVSDNGLANFKDCVDLEHLALGGTSIGDDGLAHLKNMKNLAFLGLQGTKVNDAGLVHLKACKLLGELHLWQTRITGTGFVHLKEMPNLSRLFLAECPVTDDSVDALSACVKLRTLGLTKTRLSAAGVQKLSTALPLCQIESDHGKFGPGNK